MLVNLTKEELHTILRGLASSSEFEDSEIESLVEKLNGIYDACTCKEG